jgi:peptidoglycan endopeptidase LytE
MRNRSLKRVGLMMAAAFVFMPFPAMLEGGKTTQAQSITEHAVQAQSSVGATSVVVNGKWVGSVTPTRIGNTYYVPFTKMADYLGYDSISFNSSTKTYRVTDGSVSVSITIGSTQAKKGDERVNIQAPIFINSTGYITVDSVNGLFNVFAYYNATNGSIPIQMPATLYKVQAGDSLFQIAQAHHTTVEAVRSANGLASDQVNVGQFLRLPGQALTREMEQVQIQTSAPPSTMDAKRQAIITTAKRHLGKPYKYGASASAAPNVFDCSSFTQYVFKQNGISLPRDSRAQGGEGVQVSVSELQPGDLLFFKQPSRYSDGRIGHVSIYAGGGDMVHSVSPRGTEVKKNWQSNSYYKKNFLYAKRIIR